jgi:predicted ATPase
VQRISPILVGRFAEIERLDNAFAAVRSGAPRAVLIGGEADGG